MTAPVPTVLHVVESWRPIATGYTSRGWHVVEHQAQENISRPRVLVTSRQQVHGGGGILVPPGVPVRLLDPSPAERRWRRWRRWYVDRAALAAHITHAADGADLIHVHWASAIGAAAADAAEELGIPLVAEVRFDLAGAFTSETLALPAPFERALRRRFEVHLARAAQVVAASRSLAGLLMDQFPALKSRITVVPNGVAQTLPARRCIRSSDRVTFGTTANMLRYEGLEQLIDAVEGLGGVDLLFIGGGPQRAALERRARRAGIAAEFVGHVPSSEIPAQLSRLDAFVVPRPSLTVTRFASPIKLVEAMAAGLPVVASDVGDAAELLADGRGILVPPGDAAALRSALSGLARNPAHRHLLGAKAAAWVGEKLRWPDVVAWYRPVYAAALDRELSQGRDIGAAS